MVCIYSMVNSFVEFYLDYVSIEYGLVLSRMQLHHKILILVNDTSPKLMGSTKLLKPSHFNGPLI